MRVDKFLWAIRVMKTRSRVATHCKEGKVSLEGDKLKPSKILNIGDVVVVRKGAVSFSFKVVLFPKSRVGAALVSECAIVENAAEVFYKIERFADLAEFAV